MAAMSSLEAVRRKIRSLQEQADAAEERAGRLQREVDQERALREEVGVGGCASSPPARPRPLASPPTKWSPGAEAGPPRGCRGAAGRCAPGRPRSGLRLGGGGCSVRGDRCGHVTRCRGRTRSNLRERPEIG